MATASHTKLMTAEDFMEVDLGEGRFELVRGEVIEASPSVPAHGVVCANVAAFLWDYGRRSGYGYALSNDADEQTEHDPDTVRGADVSFYSHARWPLTDVRDELIPVPPDVAVEVISPSNRRGAVLKKIGKYREAGILMIWVVHPKKRYVAVYRGDEGVPVVHSDGDILEDFPELPGFRCPVVDFFPPALPQ